MLDNAVHALTSPLGIARGLSRNSFLLITLELVLVQPLSHSLDTMSAPYSYANSDSGSDSDDAPEAVSFSSSRQGRRDDERREREAREK